MRNEYIDLRPAYFIDVILTDWHHASILSLTNQQSSLLGSTEDLVILLYTSTHNIAYKVTYSFRKSQSLKTPWQPASRYNKI